MSLATLKNFLLTTSAPQVHETAFIAPGAVVLGAVTLAEHSSVWYTAVLRGDINRIVLGPETNVQDGSVLHVSDDFPCILGIAAGALVTKDAVIPEGSLVVGSPARVVRALSREEMEANARLARKYVEISRRYREIGLAAPATAPL